MIRTVLSDLYYVEWFVLSWVICITLNNLHYVEWFVLRWKFWTTLNDLYKVELFVVQRWMICTTLNDIIRRCKIFITANDLYIVERFILRWMIRSPMDDLYNAESFGLFALISELSFSWFGNIKKKYIQPCPRNWS